MGKYNDIQQEAIDERIESFLRGTMTEEEEANFKQEIKDFISKTSSMMLVVWEWL